MEEYTVRLPAPQPKITSAPSLYQAADNAHIDNEKFTKYLFAGNNAKGLSKGVALNLQASIEAQGNINAAYEGLKPQQKYIYALYYLLNDKEFCCYEW